MPSGRPSTKNEIVRRSTFASRRSASSDFRRNERTSPGWSAITARSTRRGPSAVVASIERTSPFAAAGLADLASVPGISAAVARKVYDHFHAEA